jgi:hypothetical protein
MNVRSCVTQSTPTLIVFFLKLVIVFSFVPLTTSTIPALISTVFVWYSISRHHVAQLHNLIKSSLQALFNLSVVKLGSLLILVLFFNSLRCSISVPCTFWFASVREMIKFEYNGLCRSPKCMIVFWKVLPEFRFFQHQYKQPLKLVILALSYLRIFFWC